MTFTSLLFALFVGITLIVYFLPPLKHHQWMVLLIASYFFYAYNSYKYMAFILLTTITIYLAGKALDKTVREASARAKEMKGVWDKADVDTLAEKRADKSFNFNYLPNFLSEEAKTRLAGLAIAAKMEIVESKMFKSLVDGRINKQLKEMCLLDQVYVRAEDGKQTVAQYLKSVDPALSIAKVIRFEVGEGIEKKEENFAEEVAAQIKK